MKRGEVVSGKVFAISAKDVAVFITADIVPDFNAPIYQVHDFTGGIDPAAEEAKRLYEISVDFDMLPSKILIISIRSK